MKKLGRLLLLSIILPGVSSCMEMTRQDNYSEPGATLSRPAECLVENPKPSVLCAEVPTPLFDAKGDLWLTWAQGEHVYISKTGGAGLHPGEPVRVTDKAYRVDKNGENRPKAAIAPNGEVYVSFTAKGEKKFTGVVYFSRSEDGGKTFSAPVPISDEATPSSQRLEVIKVAPDGRLFMAWVDKRDTFTAEKNETEYRGASIYFIISDDGGRTFTANRKAVDNSCECCRIALDINPEGNAELVWRHVFEPNIRDHAIKTINRDGTLGPAVRLSIDQWEIDGCPHHGPSLSINDKGVRHVAWYTLGKAREGLFYSHSNDGGKSYSEPLGFGRMDQMASHPYVLSVSERTFIAWKEFTGRESEFLVMQSADGGHTWSTPLSVARSAGGSDHPRLINDGKWLYASWGTALEGWRLFKVAPLGMERPR
jgi:hypothetical protein